MTRIRELTSAAIAERSHGGFLEREKEDRRKEKQRRNQRGVCEFLHLWDCERFIYANKAWVMVRHSKIKRQKKNP